MEDAPLRLEGAFQLPLEAATRPIVRAPLGSGEPVRWLLDSGSSISLLSAEVARQRGLRAYDYAGAFETTGSTGQGRRLSHYAAFERLTLGDLVIEQPRVTLLDDPVLSAAGVDGILGQDLLSRLVIGIDMTSQRLHVLRDGGLEAIRSYLSGIPEGRGTWASMPLEFRPCPFLPFDVHDGALSFELEIDTGAEGTSLPRAAIEEIGLETTGTRRSQGVGGAREAPTYDLRGLSMWGMRIDAEVTESSGESGLLGMDVLSHMFVLLDGPSRALWLCHRAVQDLETGPPVPGQRPR